MIVLFDSVGGNCWRWVLLTGFSQLMCPWHRLLRQQMVSVYKI